MSRDATLHDLLEVAIHAAMENVHTVIPGRIKSYSGHDQRMAVVQPTVRLPMLAGPQLDVPAIHGVPLVFPATQAGSLLFPVAPGDGVLILFSEVGFGKYLGSASLEDVVDADSMHRHAMADAIAIPGFFPPKLIPPLPDALDASKTALASRDGAFVEIGDKLRLMNENTDLRKEVEKLWDALILLRQDLSAQFADISLSVGLDATFLTHIATSLATAGVDQAAGVAALETSKTELAELLT